MNLFNRTIFRLREVLRADYDALCGALVDLLEFQTVLDLGCGNGLVLQALRARGKDVQGVELSRAALDVLPPPLRERVTIANCVTLGRIGRFDFVACIEVAEHVRPEQSASLVDTITANAERWVYFAAASPYQRGLGHINCQPQFFWINEFRKRGFVLDFERTERLVERVRPLRRARWLSRNSLIFSRRG